MSSLNFTIRRKHI